MLVTIITCTNNSGKTLLWNLESVSSQSFCNIEHIIIDNVSSDDTLKIVSAYPHVSTVISEKDQGIYFAMNKGISLAKGDIIGFLNSDDYLADSKVIESIVNEFKYSDCDGVFGSLIYVKNNSSDRIHRVWKSKKYNKKNLFKGWMLPHPTFYVRKQVYEKFGSFNTKFSIASDYEIILRLLLKYNIRVNVINKILVYMQAGGVSNKNFTNRIFVHKEDRAVWKSLNIKPFWYTLYLKPLRKVQQFVLPFISYKWIKHKCPNYSKDNKFHTSN